MEIKVYKGEELLLSCIERNAVAVMRAIGAVSLAEILYERQKICLI